MRTIESPGVEIRELNLAPNTELPVGTTVFAAGYANQGPTDEVINVTSVTELELIYGAPTNASERYFYHTCKQVLQVNGNLLTTRIPYGSGGGLGYTSDYSALMFPVYPYDAELATSTVGASGNWNDPMFGLTTANTVAYTFSNLLCAESVNLEDEYSDILGGLPVSGFYVGVGGGGPDERGMPQADGTISWAGSTTLSADYMGTWEYLDDDFDTYNITLSSTGSLNFTTIKIYGQYETATASTVPLLTAGDQYYIGQPSHVVIDEDTYRNWYEGGIDWQNNINALDASSFANSASAGYAGMIVVNELKTTIDESFAGYYVAIADNTKIDRGSNYDSVLNMKTFDDSLVGTEWIDINTDRLGFALSGTTDINQGSTSEIIETVPGWDFGNEGPGGYNDSIILTTFKIRPTLYEADERVLDQLLAETFVGSFDSTRTINNQNGGAPLNFYLEDVVNEGSQATKVFINPNISKNSGLWWDPVTGENTKSIRAICGAKSNLDPNGIPLDDNPINQAQPGGKVILPFTQASADDWALDVDNLYGVGEYKETKRASNVNVGDVPAKLDRALRLVENREQLRIDIVPEAGLATIWTGMQLDLNNYADGATSTNSEKIAQNFDDTRQIEGILEAHTFDQDSDGLLSQTNGTRAEAYEQWNIIYNMFNNFCENNRKDCIFIADPLRYLYVQGEGEVTVMGDQNRNFSQHMFWPTKNLFAAANSSYACTYANWFKTYDNASSRKIWAPSSGFAAGLMVKTDTNYFPWYAPAGLTRGILADVLDIGINPTQKQRDLLYKNGINPTVFWPGDGYVLWGQKTLQKKPSAFDRINVRRLFLWLEKATLALTRYFVFEQNTVFTRSRLKGALEPIFQFAKDNEGVYDYKIVCDERNNTAEVIDRNELVVDIYIKPVRTAEFILVNFVATRTGQDFEELI